MKATSTKTVLLFLFALCFAKPATADPLVIPAGLVHVGSGEPAEFVFIGRGLFVWGVLDEPFASVPAVTACARGCPPETRVGLSSTFSGEQLARASVDGPPTTIDGRTFPGPLFYSGELLFTSSVVTVPDAADEEVRFIHPFQFTGLLTAYGNPDRAGAALFQADLSGTGQVELRLVTDGSTFRFTDLTYTFSSADPIPEPGTMTLFGLGALGLLVRKRHHRN